MKRRRFFGASGATVLMFGTGINIAVSTRAYASGGGGGGGGPPECDPTKAKDLWDIDCITVEGTEQCITKCKVQGVVLMHDCSPQGAPCYRRRKLGDGL